MNNKNNIKRRKKYPIKLKKRAVITPIIVILGILIINLCNGNIQKLTGIGVEKAQKLLPTSNGNIGGQNSNNNENNLLNNYQITYFHGLASGCSKEDISKAKQAGFTVVQLSCTFTEGGDNTTLTNTINEFKNYGLNVLVADAYFQWGLTKYFKEGDSQYNENLGRQKVQKMVEYYSQFDNVVGYWVSDEPSPKYTGDGDKTLSAVKKLVNVFHEYDPQRPALFNLLPYPFNTEIANSYVTAEIITGTDEASMIAGYEAYLNSSLDCEVPWLSIDSYPQYLNRNGATATTYFSDLRRLAERTQSIKNGGDGTYRNILTNNCILVTNHDSYKAYKQDIDFQVNASLAYGSKLTMYFTYAAMSDTSYGMLYSNGNPSEKYTYVKDTNAWAKNVGNELFNKDVKAVYHFNNVDSNESAQLVNGSLVKTIDNNIEYEKENKMNHVGRIATLEYVGENSGGSATGNASHAIVSVFDDNTIMLVNADPAFVYDDSTAASYNATASASKKRGKYYFADMTLTNAKYFDSTSGEWKSISEDVPKLSEMGLYISVSGNYIILDQGKSVLLRNNLSATTNNYTITSSKYKVDANKKYIYTGTKDFSTNNITKSGVTSASYITSRSLLHVITTTSHYDNIPIVKLKLTGYTVTGEETDGTGGTITTSSEFDISKVFVDNGFAVYDSSSGKLKIYSNKSALVDTKTVYVQKSNPTTVTAKTGLVYNGKIQSLLTVENNPEKVYLSSTVQLNSSNYLTAHEDTTPVYRKNADTYNFYWYTPGNSSYSEKSGSVKVTISKQSLAVPTLSGSFTYDGTEKTVTVNGYDSNTMTQTGDIKKTNAGTYTVKWNLNDTSNYQWSDGSITEKSATWTIAAQAEKPTPTITLSPSSGSIPWGETTSFTISAPSNIGTLSVRSTNEAVAKATLNGRTVIIDAKSVGPVNIIVESVENSNYKAGSATYQLTVTTVEEKQTPVIIVEDIYNTNGYVDKNHRLALKLTKTTGSGDWEFSCSNEDVEFDVYSENPYILQVSAPAGTNAIFNIACKENENYKKGETSYAIHVTEVNPTTVRNNELKYNGSEQELVSVSNVQGTVYYNTEEQIDGRNYETKGSTTIPKGTNVGNYKVYWYATGNSTYAGKSGEQWPVIEKGIPTIQLSETSGEIKTNETGSITVTKTEGSGTLRATSSNESVAVVSTNNNKVTITPKSAGTSTITVSCDSNDNYESATATYALTVKPAIIDISNAVLTIDPANYTYDGGAKTPTVTVKDGNKTLTNNTDYTVAITNNTNAGTATITVTGKGNYTGTKTGSFTINAKNISGVTITSDPTSYTYDGGAKTPTVTVKDGNKTLTNNTDYTVAITNNTNAGTATITVTGKGNYTGTKTGSFTINAKNISGVTITSDPTSYTYDGGAKTPTVTVKDGNKTLTNNTDYTVAITNNTNVGTATITVTGKGNYTGTKEATFTINARNISDATITLDTSSYTYDGGAKTPTPTVKIGNATLTKDTDYTVSYSNNTNAGTGTVTITGKENCTGNKNATFTIGKRELKVTAEAKRKTYGEANPALTYTYSGNVNGQTPGFTGTLTTTAANDSNVGDYNITQGTLNIKDNGAFAVSNYNMTFAGAKLTVNAKDLSNFNVTVNPTSYTYDGSAKTPEVTVKDGNTTLTKDTDYTVSYSNNTNAGTGTVTITGKGNYSGTNAKATFTIKSKDLSNFTVTLGENSYTYDGTGKTPEVTIKDENTTLTKNTDYTVSYNKNVNVGTADVVVTLKGNYSGSKTEHFTITKRELKVTAEAKRKTYGEANPALTYTYSGNVNGQTPGFTGELATTATNNSNVGEYDITQGTLNIKDSETFAVSNYNMTFVPGKLTIAKANGMIELSEEEGTVVLNCKKIIEISTTGEASVTSSKQRVATVEIKELGKVEITGVAIGEATITVTSGETANYKSATKTYSITVIPVNIESIEIKNLPKTSYIEEQELDVTGGKIKAIYNNGREETVNITKEMVTGYNKNQIGEQTLTVTYEGLTTEYTVVVREKTVTKIEMKTIPTKTSYIQNYEELDITGAKIKVYYDNGTTEEIPVTEEMISGFDNTKVGTNSITVTYGEKICTFSVEIVEKSPMSIEIAKLPTILKYVQDYGILDVTGGTLHVVFDDETESDINMKEEWVTGFNNKEVGKQTLTVTLGTKRATYEVEIINKVITKIEMEELPEKTEYIKSFEELDITGAKLKLTYNDAYRETINVLEEMVSGFDNTRLGQNKIKVTYAGKETSFNVSIVEHSVVRIEVSKMPNKVEYKQGEKIDLTGGQLKLHYNDGTFEVVNMSMDMLETNETFTTAGKKLITLKVNEQETYLEVDVKEEKVEEKQEEGNKDSDNKNTGSKDNTTAKDDIPNTGVPTGVIVAGVATLVLSGGFATIKIFKNREIK